MPLITSPARGRRLSTSLTLLGAIMVFSSVGIAEATPVGTVIDYEQTASAVIPQSSFGGAAGGDGWALAFTDTNVYNIFHHDLLRIACRSKTTGVACSGNGYSSGTKLVSDGSNRFQVAMGPPIHIDKTTNRLFTMAVKGTATSATGTSGVVEIDLASTSANPFVAFYPLSRDGEGACYLNNCGANWTSTLSNATKIGTKWYVYNYVSGVANPSLPDSRNKLLCFDFATKSPCVNQPYNVTTSGGVQGRLWEPPTIAAVGNRIFINIYGTANTNSLSDISCVDVSSTPTNCTGWPIVPNTQFNPPLPAAPTNAFTAVPAFPLLNSTGTPIGVCFPGETANACTNFAGETLTVDPDLAGLANPFNDAWGTTRGEAYVDGTRMFIPNVVASDGTSQVECYDFVIDDLCANFPVAGSSLPKTFPVGELQATYTLQIDPADPSCLWVMGHGGTKQIQNFDLQTGGACGANGFVLPINNFRESTSRCEARTWKQFALVNPTAGSFTSGTVAFVDSRGTAISGLSAQNFGASGTLDLTSLNLHSYPSFSRMHVRLVGTVTTSINVKMTWTAEYHPECTASGQTAFTSLGSSAGSAAPSPLIANTTTSAPSTTTATTTPTAPVALAELPSTGGDGSSTAAWAMLVAGALMIVMGQRRRTTRR
jgi:LPXTG-motif cell wall-anchored protein